MYGRAAISWASKKQATVALSSVRPQNCGGRQVADNASQKGGWRGGSQSPSEGLYAAALSREHVCACNPSKTIIF
eukprot:6189926-Pleurochrysis_carterae.AAC.3